MMERYSEYKDSGVDWIGEIPKDWEIKQFRFLFSENNTKNVQLKYKTQLQFKYGEIVHKENQSIDTDVLKTIKNYTVVHPNDIMINGLNLNYDFVSQRVGMVKNDGVITSAYISLHPLEHTNAKYYTYLMKAMDARKLFHGMGSGIRLTLGFKNLKNIYLPRPSKIIQEKIVTYLDNQCKQIDFVISQQQKMIDLLNERKQIIINQAVTKGINPNVEMKDSGVDWIGEIPKDWEIMKTLYCLTMPITDGPHITPILYDNGIPFISAEAVSCGDGTIDFTHMRGYISQDFYNECCKKYKPSRNDIYMIKSGATTGKVALVDTDRIFNIWSPLAVFRCKHNIMYFKYMFYLLQSNLYQSQVQIEWSFGTQQNIGMRDLERIRIPVPSVQEQISISEYLDIRLATLNDIIKKEKEKIALLQERKQIIINDVVLGKVKVS